jgi:histidine ammonia-lyase
VRTIVTNSHTPTNSYPDADIHTSTNVPGLGSHSDSTHAPIEATRRQLEETLDAIEEKLDVKKRTSEITHRVQSSYAERPVPWIVGATAVAVGVVGLIAWAIFSDD